MIGIRLIIAFVCLQIILAVAVPTGLAYGSSPPGDDAVFLYDPYSVGPNTITVSYYHPSPSTMYIYLQDYKESVVQTWTIPKNNITGLLTFNAAYDGVWYLYCRIQSWYYITDTTTDSKFSFNIADPNSTQSNLAADAVRHPQDWAIYNEAMSILNYSTNTSSYNAMYAIHSQVLQRFNHTDAYPGFRTDLELLNDMKTTGQYHGLCRSDAVILTSYARAIGIPARIIHINFTCTTGGGGVPQDTIAVHYFAEFYVLNGTQKMWIPVDGDPNYNYVGRTEANEVISTTYPKNRDSSMSREPPYWSILSVNIVTNIPQPNLMDSGFIECTYDGPSDFYKNDLPYQP